MRLTPTVMSGLCLLIIACSSDRSDSSDQDDAHPMRAVQLDLTLPDGTTLGELGYTVSNTSFQRAGNVDVRNSTTLKVRIGSLPIANGYGLALAATTSDGRGCAALGNFNINDTAMNPVPVTLICGGTAIDAAGDIVVNADVTAAPVQTCPVITGASVLPLEVNLGASIAIEGFTSSPTATLWQADGASIADPTAAATSLVCNAAGTHTLRFNAIRVGCPLQTLPVTFHCGQGMPPECEGHVCQDGYAMCGLTWPVPPSCIGFCASGGCCLSLGPDLGWSHVVADCASAPDGGS